MQSVQPHLSVGNRGNILMVDDAVVARNRAVIRSINAALTHFRDLSVTIPIGMVQMFLTVALNEGASLTELAEISDMRKSTVSRYLLDLSDKTRSGNPGYGLISRENDPQELRRNMYSLTAKGRIVLQKMLAGIRN